MNEQMTNKWRTNDEQKTNNERTMNEQSLPLTPSKGGTKATKNEQKTVRAARADKEMTKEKWG